VPLEIAFLGWCYQHEGDWEVHCTLIFQPDSSLSANTRYEFRAEPTESHMDDGADVIEGGFTTGEDDAVPWSNAPEFQIKDLVDRPESTVGECDWPLTRQYNLSTTWTDAKEASLTVLQVYQVNDDGSEENVHTIFPMGGSMTEFRQVMDPAWGTDIPTCYRVELEDAAGNASASSETVCWEVEDTGAPDDTDTPADTVGDTGVGSGTEDTESGETVQPPPKMDETCDCGTGPQAVGWPLIALACGIMMCRR
jgi:hypothetical protein